ncbi:MAG TPA: choice-of-anchor Q domain-containing protein [bacterium]|nr:choice-of-anchor Q domain-containing protein [bacterium]
MRIVPSSKFFLLVGMGLCLSAPASAADICVNSTAFTGGAPGDCAATCSGAGNCDIRDAVSKANLDNAPDTIIFDPSVFPPHGATEIDTNATLVLDTPVTLQGPGADALVLDNEFNGDVIIEINHDSGFSPAGPHVISGMKITRGYRGVHANDYDADVLLDSLVISENDTGLGGGSGDGGGIKVDNDNGLTGTVKITNCLIVGNAVSDGFGGGIEMEDNSAIEISDSFILDNTADDVGGENGGGLALQGVGPAIIRNTVISGNTADNSGGGLYASNLTELTITDSTISNNTTNDDGGALHAFNNNGTFVMPITIRGTLITDNAAADRGGGINVTADSLNDFTKLTLDISDSTLSSNTAGSAGGGIATLETTTTIVDSVLDGNDSDNNGGGIFNEGGAHLTITGSTLSRNSCAFDGGAIRNSGANSQASITNSTISGNSAASDGGGISNNNNTTNTIFLSHVTVTGNMADADFSGIGSGGGLEQESPAGPFTVQNSIIAGNVGINGGPDCASAGTPILSGGNNLIGNNQGCSNNTFDPATKNDQVGTNVSEIDPLLGLLTPFNGGDPANGIPAAVHEPLAGSPAIDGVDDAIAPPPATDQRGVSRPIGAAADIGAVEAGCGDGAVNVGEACDDGGESAACNADCTASACGDGVRNAAAGESCDDGNTEAGDGCSATCQTEACGNGILDSGEACEDGNADGGDGCSSACQFEDAGATGGDTSGGGNGTGDGGGCSLIR